MKIGILIIETKSTPPITTKQVVKMSITFLICYNECNSQPIQEKRKSVTSEISSLFDILKYLTAVKKNSIIEATFPAIKAKGAILGILRRMNSIKMNTHQSTLPKVSFLCLLM